MLIEAEVTPSLAAALEILEIGSFADQSCEVVLADGSKRFAVEQKLPAISRLAEQITGSPVKVSLTVREQGTGEDRADPGVSHHAAANHPLVKQAQELFDARIVSVEPDHDD